MPMYVVPPNNTWPRNWRDEFPAYVIPRSRSLVRVVEEGARLFDIPVITIPRARALTARDLYEDDVMWGGRFDVRPPGALERAGFEIQYQGRFSYPVFDGRPQTPPAWAERLGIGMGRHAGELLGEAMMARRDQMILNYFMFPPGSPDELARMFEAMGIEAPYGIGVDLSSGTLLAESKTLRQRCFARLFNGFDEKTGLIRMSYAGYTGVKIRPFANTLRSLMPACYRDKKLRKSLAAIPIADSNAGRAKGNPELVEPLQDLANIIAYEMRLAYEDDYYPGMPDVDPMTEEHVDQIMVAMQREIDREQRYTDDHKRYKVTAHLPDLPRERKTALAERRRHWFGVFGITPKSWKTGTWSLWKVKNVPYPEGYKIPVW